MLPRSQSNAEPAHVLQRPSSARAQDVNHILSKKFGDLFMRDPIDSQTICNLRISQGSEDAYHRAYVEKLLKVTDERQRRMDSCDRLERSIMQAKAQAMFADERQLNRVKEQSQRASASGALETLPAMHSHFRACIDDTLLHNNGLLCPRDLAQEEAPPVPLPRAQDPAHLRATSASASRSIRTAAESVSFHEEGFDMEAEEKSESLSGAWTLEEQGEPRARDGLDTASRQTRSTRTRQLKEIKEAKNRRWKENMNAEEREEDRRHLQQMQAKNHFVRNPRFLKPAEEGGSGLLVQPKHKLEDGPDTLIFSPSPQIVQFSEYDVGQVYEVQLELRNITSAIRSVSVIPPKTKYFSIGLGQFPGEKGLVAPGMACKYTVRFSPDSLRDFEDEIVVNSQKLTPLVVKITSRRPRPILTIPPVIEVGECLIFGTKIMDFHVKNEGGKGKFLLLPKTGWPSTNFKASLPADHTLSVPPFQIQPAYFEMEPGKLISLKLFFAPTDLKVYEEEFFILCDNCQIKKFTIRGTSELASLQLTVVEGGTSDPTPGEMCDVSAEHLIRFDPLHPCIRGYMSNERKMTVKNRTHVELPFAWKIVKPSCRPAGSLDEKEPPPRNRTLDVDTAFAVEPQMGTFLPQQEIHFSLSFSPMDVGDFHSALHLVLQNVPDLGPPPSQEEGSFFLTQDGAPAPAPEFNAEVQFTDVTGLELEVKGSSTPLEVTVEPQAVCLPGRLLRNTTVRKQVCMSNKSRCPVIFMWECYSESYILEIEPPMGVIDPGQSGMVDLCITGTKPGKISHTLVCRIENSTEPIPLLVEAEIKGPSISIDQPDIDFHLVRCQERASRPLWLRNQSQINCPWEARFPNNVAEHFQIVPSSGVLRPLQELMVQVDFIPLAPCRIDAQLDVQVLNGELICVKVFAEAQQPMACLLSSHLSLTELYLDVEATNVVHLLNQTSLPTTFRWEAPQGSDTAFAQAEVIPGQGMLAGREEMALAVKLKVSKVMEVSDLWIPCIVDGMDDPVILQISGSVFGLRVSFTTPPNQEEADEDEIEEDAENMGLLLDFGKEVVLGEVTKRRLIITNHTAISAPFSMELAHFPATPELISPATAAAVAAAEHVARAASSKKGLLRKTPNLADPRSKPTKYARYDYSKAMLGKKRGAAFHCEPSCGQLGPFAESVVEVTAYNDMWGQYCDSLLCDVGGRVRPIPVRLGVAGCPVEFTMTSAQPDQQPIVRFGTRTSGTAPVTRQIRLNNKSPFAIRLDWQMFNSVPEDEKLLDLCVNFGRAFPLLNDQGEEILPSLDETPVSTYRCPTGFLPDTPDTSSVGFASSRPDTCAVGPTPELLGQLEPVERIPIVNVVVRPHDGQPAQRPFTIHPTQLTIPAESYEYVHVTFTPLENATRLAGGPLDLAAYTLGFLSLDEARANEPGRVSRDQDFAVNQLRLDMTGRVDAPSLEVNYKEDDEGFFFRTVFSERLQQPCTPSAPVLSPAVVRTASAVLRNAKETDLSFSIHVPSPFLLLRPTSEHGCVLDDNGDPRINLGPRATVSVDVGFVVHQSQLERLEQLKMEESRHRDEIEVMQSRDPIENTESREPIENTESRDPIENTESRDPIENTESRDPIEKTESRDPIEATESRDPIENAEVCDPIGSKAESKASQALSTSKVSRADSFEADGAPVSVRTEGEESVLKFREAMSVTFSNGSVQQLPIRAAVIFPGFLITKNELDFGTCFVGQTRELQLQIVNPTGSDCVWWTRIESVRGRFEGENEPFEVRPSSGFLEGAVTHISKNKTLLRVFFTPSHADAYEFTVIFEGVLGEAAKVLSLRGEGSFDGQYEATYNV